MKDLVNCAYLKGLEIWWVSVATDIITSADDLTTFRSCRYLHLKENELLCLYANCTPAIHLNVVVAVVNIHVVLKVEARMTSP